MFGYEPEHNYSLAVIGLSKHYDGIFGSRQAATEYMYKVCQKYGLRIEKIWDDKHDKTYICNNGVTFYIQRAY